MTHTRRTARLLFLLVFLTGSVCGVNVSVWQTPRMITAASGERVSITCHFTLRTSQRGGWRTVWRKNNTEFQHNSYNISVINPDTQVNKSDTLTLPSVSVRDSGVYYCSVLQNIPVLRSGTDREGTELIVASTVRSTTTSTSITTPTAQAVKTVIWMMSLALALMIACFTSVACCIHRAHMKRKKESQSEQTDDTGVVYAAVKLHKPHEKKNTQETSDAPDAGGAANEEVLYSHIRVKS